MAELGYGLRYCRDKLRDKQPSPVNRKPISLRLPELQGKDHDAYYQGKTFEEGMGIDDLKYAARFEKAFRHAVTLCGGRPSVF
jgi:hypothetical protein